MYISLRCIIIQKYLSSDFLSFNVSIIQIDEQIHHLFWVLFLLLLLSRTRPLSACEYV